MRTPIEIEAARAANEALQKRVDDGQARQAKMQAEAEKLAEQVSGVIGRGQALAKALDVAKCQKLTVAEIKELTTFCFEFVKKGVVPCVVGLILLCGLGSTTKASPMLAQLLTTPAASETTVDQSPPSSVVKHHRHHHRHHHRRSSKASTTCCTTTMTSVPLPRARPGRGDELATSFADRWPGSASFMESPPQPRNLYMWDKDILSVPPAEVQEMAIGKNQDRCCGLPSVIPKPKDPAYTPLGTPIQQETTSWTALFSPEPSPRNFAMVLVVLTIIAGLYSVSRPTT